MANGMSDAFERAKIFVEGKIIHLGEPEQITDKFKKTLMVIREEGDYDNRIPIEVVNDKIEYLKNFKVGDEVKAFYNVRGNAGKGKFEGRWFVNLRLWKLEKYQKKTWTNEEDKFVPDEIPF
tara:strand:+ start:45 stop:410 length:366 start_codon:yes stop_codon:yes gene_type:complete